MKQIEVQFKKLTPDAKIPTRSTEFAMGYDMYCIAEDNNQWIRSTDEGDESRLFILYPGQVHKFRTGIAGAIEPGFGCLIWDRSGLGSKGIHRLAGVIDSDYRGEWLVCLVNVGLTQYTVCAGDRIAQAIFTEQTVARITEVNELPGSVRDTAGFGSTGR